jgi:hypothetical protein
MTTTFSESEVASLATVTADAHASTSAEAMSA